MFSWSTSSDSSPSQTRPRYSWEGDGEDGTAAEQDDMMERGFFDRLFAPFEAPQQFLFSLTRDIAEDGFQGRDLWNAMSHGVRYFNPWSDEGRISEDDITDIFFGDIENNFLRGAATLGVSLLYDPLAVGGLAKLVGAPARAVSLIDRVANPAASVVMDGVSAAARAAKPVVSDAVVRLAGPERTQQAQNWFNNWLRPPSASQPREFLESTGRANVQMEEYRYKIAPIVKKVKDIGGIEGDRLFAEMIDNAAVYTSLIDNVPVESLNRAAREQFQGVVQKIEAAGIDKGLIFEQYQRAMPVLMDIQDTLFKSGQLTRADMAIHGKTHLRYMYTNMQNPYDMERRLNKLVELTQGNTEYRHLYESLDVVDPTALYDEVQSIARQTVDVTSELGMGVQTRTLRTTPGGRNESIRQRYFPSTENGATTFDGDVFFADLNLFMRENPMASPVDVVKHMHNDMFGLEQARRLDLPYDHVPEEIVTAISNALATGTKNVGGTQARGAAVRKSMTVGDMADMLAQGKAGTQVQFRTLRENMDVLTSRHAIPEEIRREVLGMPDAATPRIVSQVETAGRQAAIRGLFDEVSGAVRLSPEDFDNLQEMTTTSVAAASERAVRSAVSKPNSPLTRAQLLEDSELQSAWGAAADDLMGNYPNLSKRRAREIVEGVSDGTISPGDLISRSGEGIAVRPRSGQVPEGYVLVPDGAESLGSLAGMAVPHSVMAALNNYSKVVEGLAGVNPETAITRIGGAMRSLTSFFKFTKIIADPSAHFRDFAGSLLSMDVVGVNMFNKRALSEAFDIVNDSRQGVIHEALQDAHDIGYNLIMGGMSGTELRRQSGLASRTNFARSATADWIDKGTDSFAQLADRVRDGANSMGAVYQYRESVMRSYVFASKRTELLEDITRNGGELTREVRMNVARQAAELTNKALFDYADVPFAMDFARSYGIAPFITFPVKAIGQLTDALYNSPMKVLKYDRIMDSWNNMWAGGDDEQNREINALQPHLRDAMVVRLPGTNTEGNPLYLDLSYFIPWAAVRDVAGEFQGYSANLSGVGVGDDGSISGNVGGNPGQRGAIISPVITQITNAFTTGTDGLGRRLWPENPTADELVTGIGRFMYQFITPPTMPGGSTADSVGRSIMAAARTSPEPVDWVAYLGQGMRTAFRSDDVLNRYGEAPAGRALPTLTDNPVGQVGLGLASLFLPVSESDAPRQSRNEAIGAQVDIDSFSQSISTVMNNNNLTRQQKADRAAELLELIRARQRNLEQYRNSVR